MLEHITTTSTGLSSQKVADILNAAKNWTTETVQKVESGFSYFESHVHTQHSLLDGVDSHSKMVETALDLGHPGMAITNHGVTSDLPDYKFMKTPTGFKKIFGCEVYVNTGTVDEPSNHSVHLILLAKNKLGYKNLLSLVSRAFVSGIKVRAKYTIPMDAMTRENLEGIVVTSACLGGPLGSIYTSNSETEDFDAEKTFNLMLAEAKRWNAISENFFLEVQNYEVLADEYATLREDEQMFIHQQLAYNEFLYRISSVTGIPVVATNDCHYAKPAGAKVQDVLLAIARKTSLKDPNRFRFASSKHYMKSKWEMLWLFRNHPEAVFNTEKLFDLVEDMPEEEHGYYLPLYPLTETKEEQIAAFHSLVSKGLRKFYSKPENLNPLIEKFGSREKALNMIKERSEYEKNVLLSMGFEGYMLLVSWCIQLARDNNVLVGHGRGSCAGSIVALALEITDFCPLRYDLIFERFLNPDRISMPDIDVDYQYEYRGDIIKLIQSKLGADKMAQIVTYGRMKAKAAIRNAGKVLDVPLSKVDYIAKMIPSTPKATISSALEENPELLAAKTDTQVQEMLDLAIQLEGRIKNTSVHAAGVILSSVPITEVVALTEGKGAILPVIQTEMNNVDHLGLVKQDFLGLRTLSVIAEAIRLINERHPGVNLKYEDIPRDDKKTFELLASGDSVACFQLESAGMRQLMRDIHIETISDIIDCIALYRPGVLSVGMHQEYVKNKYNPDGITYLHPLMKEILAPTRGILIYQEQAMQLSNKLAGFSMAEADTLRKAIGKKNLDLMGQLKSKFVDGCKNVNGIEKPVAEKIWELIEVMSGYSFNKSHSAAYAMTAIDTAYLKANYPIEFMTAAISKAAEGKSPKLPVYLAEARRMGIPVLPPSVNKSEQWFSITENNEIVFGLQAVKDVGKCSDELVAERENNGPFKDIIDFRKRCQFVNKSALTSLVRVGAFDEIETNRNCLLAIVPDVIKIKPKTTKKNPIPHFLPEYNFLVPELPAPTKKEILNAEMELCSIFITDHPFSDYVDEMKNYKNSKSIEEFHTHELPDKSWTLFGGYVLNKRDTMTKKGLEMTILTVDDISAQVECILWPNTYAKFKDLLTEGESYVFKGHLEYKENFAKNNSADDSDDDTADTTPQIIVNSIERFPEKSTQDTAAYMPLTEWLKGRGVTIC